MAIANIRKKFEGIYDRIDPDHPLGKSGTARNLVERRF